MIAAIVLAAGLSTRLGRPKQLVELAGETLLARAIRIAAEAGLSPLLGVISDPNLVEPLENLGATAVLNHHPSEGLSSSIRLGIAEARTLGATGAVLLTCDQPALTPGHLRDLIFDPGNPAASFYASRPGIPAYFPSDSFESLLELTGDHGAKSLLQKARAVPAEALSLDIDTEADLQRAIQLFHSGQLTD